MPFTVDPRGGQPGRSGAALGVSGEFDLAAVDTWNATAFTWCERLLGDVVVDLLQLRFIDAAGMGALVGLGNRLRASGRRLSLAGPAPNVRRALVAGGLDHLFAA